MGSRGLVLGKFAPLHRGHQHLIETAKAAVDELVVAVYETAWYDAAPAATRARWVEALHPGVRVVLVADLPPDSYDDASATAAHARQLASALGSFTDVFTSEPYGDELAELLGATHTAGCPSTAGSSGRRRPGSSSSRTSRRSRASSSSARHGSPRRRPASSSATRTPSRPSTGAGVCSAAQRPGSCAWPPRRPATTRRSSARTTSPGSTTGTRETKEAQADFQRLVREDLDARSLPYVTLAGPLERRIAAVEAALAQAGWNRSPLTSLG
jgi:cytidyltransferase-like protein